MYRQTILSRHMRCRQIKNNLASFSPRRLILMAGRAIDVASGRSILAAVEAAVPSLAQLIRQAVGGSAPSWLLPPSLPSFFSQVFTRVGLGVWWGCCDRSPSYHPSCGFARNRRGVCVLRFRPCLTASSSFGMRDATRLSHVWRQSSFLGKELWSFTAYQT